MIFLIFFLILNTPLNQYRMNSKCEQCMIRELNSLKELTKEELVRISHCKTVKTIKKGEILFDEGEYINGVFCIKSGVCKISKMSDNGREQIVHLTQKGNLLGERSLITNETANLKATALNDMEVCFIPRNEIVKDLKDNNNFSLDILKRMAYSLKNTDNAMVDLAQKSVKQRMAITLLYLEDTFGVNENDAINITLNRNDIAGIAGTTIESTIRLLSTFKKNGYIKLQNKSIILLDKKNLKNLSENL